MPKSKNNRKKPSRPRALEERAAPVLESKGGPVVQIRGAEHFEKVVLASELPVIVDFWAPWCVPCRMMAPIFEKAAEAWEGRVAFVKLNTEAVPSVAQRLEITSIPSLLVFHRGEVFDVRIGVTPASSLEAMAQRVFDRHEGVGFLDRLKRSIGLGGGSSP